MPLTDFASSRSQRGMSLIESLIALLVLALGLLGLAGMQTRLLVENRIGNQRAIAVGLIDDLINRMIVNRNAVTAGNYTLNWGATKTAVDCISSACSASSIAQSDLNQWRANVTAALPGADATIFTSGSDGRQVGVAVAWASNEAAAASDSAYTTPFAITASGNGVSCPTGSICHLVYFQP